MRIITCNVNVLRSADRRKYAFMDRFLPRERNIGWRIDYQIATPGIAAKATKAAICTREIFSDHAPVVVDYDPAL